MNYREKLLEIIKKALDGTMNYSDFMIAYEECYIEEVPEDALTESESIFFDSVHDMLCWTASEPSETARSRGYISYEECIVSLKNAVPEFEKGNGNTENTVVADEALSNIWQEEDDVMDTLTGYPIILLPKAEYESPGMFRMIVDPKTKEIIGGGPIKFRSLKRKINEGRYKVVKNKTEAKPAIGFWAKLFEKYW